MSIQPTLSTTRFLAASRCNGQRCLSLQELVRELIDLATDHANLLGVGYARLAESGMAWVLSRLSVEMEKWPAMHSTYTLTTWVESFSRLFSSRCFELREGGEEGPVIGYIRSIWAAIDVASRRPADLSELTPLAEAASARQCPIAPHPRLRMPEESEERQYTFMATDIDCNRHVTTARYVELILDSLTLDEYDREEIGRFDITFTHEALAGQKATIETARCDDGVLITAIKAAEEEARQFCIARQAMRPRMQPVATNQNI